MGKTRQYQGFTLIELSIVMVIVGLLIGGIIAGKEMIRAAEVRKQIAQIDSLDLAFLAFKQKYNCIPGDCAKAVDYDLGSPSGPGANGSGDGAIFTDPWITEVHNRKTETLNAWYHLSEAMLIPEILEGYSSTAIITNWGSYVPRMKLNKNGYINAWTVTGNHPSQPDAPFGNSYYLTQLQPWPDPPAAQINTNHVPAIDAITARSIDTKMDDGKPFSGKVNIGSEYSGPMIYTTAFAIGNCTTAAGEYASYSGQTGSVMGCNLAVRAKW